MRKIYTPFLVVLTIFGISSTPCIATVINIPDDYPTIQEGVDAAMEGDTVLVAPGEYVETIVISDKNILLSSSDGPQITIIRGNIDLTGSLETRCVLRGFAVDAEMGGSSVVYIYGGSPVVQGNIIRRGGSVFNYGGGIWARESGATIRDNIIEGNFASFGGGVCADSAVVIERNIIADNSVSGGHGVDGGGLISVAGIIRYNLIVDNSAANAWNAAGGGMFVYCNLHQGIRIYNNTIVNNSASAADCYGGGISMLCDEFPHENTFFRNNIIAFNTAGGIYSTLPDTAELDWDYNLVFGNEDYDYEGIIPGEHDIQEDPLFVDRFSGDYHLLPNSPCIDAGDPDFPLDPDSTRADIGAYYFDQTVGIDDPEEPSGPYNFRLRQNYPNPFNARTIISYNLTEESSVSLMVFSIRGHLISSIVNKEIQPAGEYQYVWDGFDTNRQMVSTGIYFYELYVDGYRESKAMILIK
jgi:hypothetical protein